MLSHDCRDSSSASLQQQEQQQKEPWRTVTISADVDTSRPPVTAEKTRIATHIRTPLQHPNITSADMAGETGLLECPMCDFTVLPTDDYILQLHFEQVHTTDSPFKIEDDAEPPLPTAPSQSLTKRKHKGGTSDTTSSDDEEDTVTCPEPDCGEAVLLADFNEHLNFHAAETLSFDETTGKYHSHHSSATMQALAHDTFTKDVYLDHSFATDLPEALKRHGDHGHKLKKHGHRKRSNTNSSEKSTLSRSILTFNPFTNLDKSVKPPNKSARLGKSELGPHAWEERMPRWLHDQLAAGPKITVVNRIGRDGRLINQEQVQNETPGIIPILAQLSALDRSVKEAYYCHPSTLHVGKTPREGGFCGYRNIQMLLSYIQGAKAQGHEEFPGRTPGILNIQDLIETAWDKGINQIGRVQTGGIRDTRKYIGTPEAQAFFLSSEINCAVEMFSDNKERKIEAHETLLDAAERYFAQAAVKDGSNVYKTLLPPIYLQQPGHSITIVGFERYRSGACNLVVFDPMYSTSPAMHKLLGRKNIQTARPEVLHAYRRSARQLRKHAAFEILMLTATPPLFPAWDVLRQFPECRFVYAFFRSRTLGYDVYPEDYFLPSFPWQQYGGLWVCDEARFARAEPVDATTAQALQRITGQGSSTRTSSPMSPFSSGDCHSHASALHIEPRLSIVSLLDGVANSPVFNVGSFVQPETTQPHLSFLTDIGRKYPGFPTPLSPTSSAKEKFPSPVSDRVMSPTVRSVSPVSVDGSEMCGPGCRCASHGYQHYASSMGLIDSIIAQASPRHNPATYTPPSTPVKSSTDAFSPRSPILKSLYIQPPPHMTISNGDLTSPLSSRSTTILSYTSHRPITSGLLALTPLDEIQVAEYRFWTPCGRRVCALGCGRKNEGEWAAQKRLFRGVDEEVSVPDNGLRGGEEDWTEAEAAPRKSEWAGRRYVGDWRGFLSGCEREGVARY